MLVDREMLDMILGPETAICKNGSFYLMEYRGHGDVKGTACYGIYVCTLDMKAVYFPTHLPSIRQMRTLVKKFLGSDCSLRGMSYYPRNKESVANIHIDITAGTDSVSRAAFLAAFVDNCC